MRSSRRRQAVKVGNGLEDGVQMGPLANPRRLEAVERFVDDAVGGGATVACGGKRMRRAGLVLRAHRAHRRPGDART